MDKASAYGAGDCRFESCRGHFDLQEYDAKAQQGEDSEAPREAGSCKKPPWGGTSDSVRGWSFKLADPLKYSG